LTQIVIINERVLYLSDIILDFGYEINCMMLVLVFDRQ